MGKDHEINYRKPTLGSKQVYLLFSLFYKIMEFNMNLKMSHNTNDIYYYPGHKVAETNFKYA